MTGCRSESSHVSKPLQAQPEGRGFPLEVRILCMLFSVDVHQVILEIVVLESTQYYLSECMN